MTSQSAQDQASREDEFIETLSRHQEGLNESVSEATSHVDERICRGEELLKAQSERLQDSQATQLRLYYKGPSPEMSRRFAQDTNEGGGSPPTPRAESIGVRLTQHNTTCTRGCPCACHKQRRSSTPAFWERIVGKVFVDYAGLPIFSQRCNIPSCTRDNLLI